MIYTPRTRGCWVLVYGPSYSVQGYVTNSNVSLIRMECVSQVCPLYRESVVRSVEMIKWEI